MRDDIHTAREKTRAKVAQITGWCLVVALHQTYGVGGRRQERCAAAATRLEERYAEIIAQQGRVKALEQLQQEVRASLGGKVCSCPLEMRVPLRRAPRTRREEQLAQAGHEAATFAWLIFAWSIRTTLGYGSERLRVLHHETVENYRQFNSWAALDEREAWEKLRHCAQQAIGEEIDIVDDDSQPPQPLMEQMRYQDARQANLRSALQDHLRAGADAPPLAVLSPAARREILQKIGPVPGEKR